MKTSFWLSVFFVLVLTGCATTPSKHKQDQVLKIRNLAEAYLAEGKYVPAYRELMKALKLDPKDAHVHYDLGIFYFQKKKFDRAIEEYQVALKLKPDFATARNNLGVVYMEMKEWDKATETLTPLTEDYLYATPHFPHFLIGQAYFHQQEYQKAVEHFQACRELKADFPFAAHWLGKTYLATGKAHEAIRELKKALELSPAAVFLLDLGRAYTMVGNFNKANAAFEKAACIATDDTLKERIFTEKRLLKDKISAK